MSKMNVLLVNLLYILSCLLTLLLSLTADSSSEKTTKENKTYLLCNRVRVYTCIPDMIFSKGNVALPIAEGKWVVVNLEFPKEKDA